MPAICQPPEFMPSVQAEPVALQTNHGYFHNAHNFSMHNSTMYNVEAHYHKNIDVLTTLAKYTIVGAEFDSSARDPPPRCHPDTREKIVQSLQTQTRSINPEKRLLWLRGPAGVGKSAIMQTLAESESSFMLGATIFFSKAQRRNKAAGVFATIAYQLAVRIPAYRAYVGDLLIADPKCLDKSMADQFRMLITIPFAERRLHDGPISRAILLDGLDECQGGREQCAVTGLITELILRFPSIPLIWVIASRPESHLKTFFSRPEVHACCLEQEILIDPDARRDVEYYLQAEFSRIQHEYPELISSTQRWPSISQFNMIENAAAGLFVFASTVIGYIDDPDYGDPVSRLSRLLSVIHSHSMTSIHGNDTNPLHNLDVLYGQIMSDIHPSKLPIAKRVLGYYSLGFVSGHFAKVYNFQVACNILGLERHAVYSTLGKLRSVLELPLPKDAWKTTIGLVHLSFLEYLGDPIRSHDYSISSEDAVLDLFSCLSRILKQLTTTSRDRDVQIHSVQLSWPFDDNEHHRNYFLRKAVSDASALWGDMLSPFPYTFSGLYPGMSRATRLPSFELQMATIFPILENLNFSKLAIYVPHEAMVTFWVRFRGYASAQIINRLTAASFPFRDLDIERALINKPVWLFEATQERYLPMLSRWQMFWPDASVEGYSPKDVVSAVLDDIPPSTEVTILGNTPQQCCAVIEYKDPDGLIVRCFFPYSLQ